MATIYRDRPSDRQIASIVEIAPMAPWNHIALSALIERQQAHIASLVGMSRDQMFMPLSRHSNIAELVRAQERILAGLLARWRSLGLLPPEFAPAATTAVPPE